MSFFIDRGYARPGGIESKIEALHENNAEIIIKLTRENPLTIVTGPFGIGKSKSLFPLITHKLTQIFIPSILSGELSPSNNLIPGDVEYMVDQINKRIPQVENGVFIYDETATESPDKLSILIQAIHNRGYSSIIANVAHSRNEVNQRDSIVKLWQRSGEEIHRRTAPVYNIPAFYLTPELAREFLSTPSSAGSNIMKPEVINFLLTFLPLNPLVLTHIKTHNPKSIDEVIHMLPLSITEHLKMVLTREERLRLNKVAFSKFNQPRRK